MALQLADLEYVPEGHRLRPKALLAAWFHQAGIADGFLFRRLTASDVATPSPTSDRAVARLVQARCSGRLQRGGFAKHSLGAGFLTAAAPAGASVFKMREVSRHKSIQVLADHVRNAELFRDHAGEGFYSRALPS